jgi:hypothetical protein
MAVTEMKAAFRPAGSARVAIVLGVSVVLAGCGAGSAPAAPSPSPAEPTNAVAEPTVAPAEPTQAPARTSAPSPELTATATPTVIAPSPTPIDHSPGTGSWILYQAVYGEYWPVDLGLVRLDGSDAHRIGGGPGNRWHPDWSPDGTQIAYDHELPDERRQLAVANLDGSSPDHFLTECAAPCMLNVRPAWSPDGRMIGFDGWDELPDRSQVCYLALLDVASGEITRVIEWRDRRLCAVDSHDPDLPLNQGMAMRFSPDGGRIVFMGYGPSDKTAIFSATIQGKDVQQLTEWGLGARPDWSPDGEWIVFHSEEPPHENRPEVSLYRVRPDGTDLQRLTSPGDRVTDVYPRYLPDGSAILFSRCLSLWECETRMIDPDGSNDRLLFGELGRQTVHVMLQP